MALDVFHCDDSVPFTELVRFWLSDHHDLEHVGAVHDRAAALDSVPAARPDVVLLDTLDAGPEEPSLVEDVRRLAPGAHIIVYSSHAPGVARRVVDGRPDAVVQKADDERELVSMIRRLAAALRNDEGPAVGRPLSVCSSLDRSARDRPVT